MIEEWVIHIIPDLTREDLPASYQEVARIAGVETAVKLSEALGGLAYYFPQIDGILRKKRNEKIRSEFTGANYRTLATKYHLTEIQIRTIVDSTPRVDQPSLF